MSESEESPEPRDKAVREGWSTTKVVATSLITIIGTIASVIGVIQVLARDTTDLSSLRISAEVVSGGRSDWAVPARLVAEIPSSAGGGCDSSQIEWLEANAQRLDRHLMLTVSNSAQEGAMLAVTQLRSNAEAATERGEIHVLLICEPDGIVPDTVHYGRVDVDKPEESARLITLEYNRPPRSAAGVPLTYNLAPGESGQFVVELFSKYPASGALKASVLHREESHVIDVPGTEFQLPSLLFAGDMYLVTGKEGVACRRAEAGSLSDCTLEDVSKEVARAER